MRLINLKLLAEQHKKKLSQIKVFLTDCDGVLTNSQLYWAGEEVGWTRFFNAQDGYGLKLLQRHGLKVGIISGGASLGLEKRCENLQVDFAFLGSEDKRSAYLQVLDKGYKDEEILYIGDDFFDLPILRRAGFSATVPHASMEICEEVDYVTQREGGQGCVRELVDILRYAQDIVPHIIDFEI